MNSCTDFDRIAEPFSTLIPETKKYIRTPLLLHLLGDISFLSVADFGCGDGYFTRIAAAQNPRKIIGIDHSAALLAKAKAQEAQCKKGMLYYQADIRTCRYPENFDLIFSVYLLNHAQTAHDLFLMAHAMSRHLSWQGMCCAIVPHPRITATDGYQYSRRIHIPYGLYDGAPLIYTVAQGDQICSFPFTYWRSETYEAAFRKAGFKECTWIEPSTRVIPDMSYWSNFREHPSCIGVRLTK
jgi:SAM-dependent methyltransferase